MYTMICSTSTEDARSKHYLRCYTIKSTESKDNIIKIDKRMKSDQKLITHTLRAGISFVPDPWTAQVHGFRSAVCAHIRMLKRWKSFQPQSQWAFNQECRAGSVFSFTFYSCQFKIVERQPKIFIHIANKALFRIQDSRKLLSSIHVGVGPSITSPQNMV